MRRNLRKALVVVIAVGVIVGAIVLIGNLGNKTATVSEAGPGGSVSMVITGKADALAFIEQQLTASAPAIRQAGGTVTTVDGDHHVGTQWCSVRVAEKGHDANVSIYSASSAFGQEACGLLVSPLFTG